jgi:HD-GYP domain-containing protein (c-di-GMP phosphodiesterase class II)
MHLINLSKVLAGDVLGDTVYGANGQPLLYGGVKLTSDYLEQLRNLGIAAVYVHDSDTIDIEVPHPITPEARGRAMRNLAKSFDAVSHACEGLRKASVETIQEHFQSDRFSSAVRGAGGGDALAGLCSDVDQFLEQLMKREVLAGLNSIKTHDSYTYQHSIDVTVMAIVLAQRLGWDRRRLKSFAVGCMLHDIGKIFIEPEILNKATRLTDEEFERIKSHPLLGYSLIRAIAPSLGPLVTHVAYQHHERQDGTGYPRGLRGDNTLGANRRGLIHDFGAVCAVADVYDAMSSDRPYREAWSPDRVMSTIFGMSRTHLNRVAVQVLTATVAPYPLCTRVRILNGRYAGYEGIVSKIYEQTLGRPRVRVMFKASEERISPVEIDLRAEQDVMVESARNKPAAPRAFRLPMQRRASA